MLKRTLVALATLLVASTAFAGKYPRFINEVIRVEVGQTVEAELFASHSGFSNYPTEFSWVFSSSDRQVANVDGRLASPSSRGTVKVTGLAPGQSYVITSSYPSSRLARIVVSCGDEKPVVAATPEVTVRVNEEAELTTAFADLDRTMFTWYRGRLGDRSQVLDELGPSMLFAADRPGDYYIWVAAESPCSTSRTEFHIEVIQPRRRGAGR
ncbi:MAG TPA: hypothetical protein VGF69_13250 [Thermoanaerobaculia bacterium]|jgi:hypothetical protein